jgi:hypothetical protein
MVDKNKEGYLDDNTPPNYNQINSDKTEPPQITNEKLPPKQSPPTVNSFGGPAEKIPIPTRILNYVKKGLVSLPIINRFDKNQRENTVSTRDLVIR